MGQLPWKVNGRPEEHFFLNRKCATFLAECHSESKGTHGTVFFPTEYHFQEMIQTIHCVKHTAICMCCLDLAFQSLVHKMLMWQRCGPPAFSNQVTLRDIERKGECISSALVYEVDAQHTIMAQHSLEIIAYPQLTLNESLIINHRYQFIATLLVVLHV